MGKWSIGTIRSGILTWRNSDGPRRRMHTSETCSIFISQICFPTATESPSKTVHTFKALDPLSPDEHEHNFMHDLQTRFLRVTHKDHVPFDFLQVHSLVGRTLVFQRTSRTSLTLCCCISSSRPVRCSPSGRVLRTSRHGLGGPALTPCSSAHGGCHLPHARAS